MKNKIKENCEKLQIKNLEVEKQLSYNFQIPLKLVAALFCVS